MRGLPGPARSRGDLDRLSKPQPAVDGQNLAGDKRRAGGEEKHGLRDIVRGSIAAHRRLAAKRRVACLASCGSSNSIQPGATQLTLTSGAKALAMVLREHVQRGLGSTSSGRGRPRHDSRPSEPMLTIRPCAARRCGSASRATRNGPRVLVSKTASHCSRRHALERSGLKDGGVVHQQVEAAEVCIDLAPRLRAPRLSERTSHSMAMARRPSACNLADCLLRLHL